METLGNHLGPRDYPCSGPYKALRGCGPSSVVSPEIILPDIAIGYLLEHQGRPCTWKDSQTRFWDTGKRVDNE